MPDRAPNSAGVGRVQVGTLNNTNDNQVGTQGTTVVPDIRLANGSGSKNKPAGDGPTTHRFAMLVARGLKSVTPDAYKSESACWGVLSSMV